ncbi:MULTISPECIES: Ig-like domain-containing protein [Bacillus]|jgi:hypothetical protein|uniref:Bacterial Ig domain-containing protein n=2 Tax=Bacillus cereus group TaxID=86661 RepID=Q73CG1_BACC1|nr:MULTISPECIES: Ig-like domain-containing protein [Bacillus]AAS40035.1 hypothetical protein BCE_1104 [Bacillus cereus ATCC 10987]KMQ34775.1 hypothetical protein TU53_09815 [Bacillus cereus]KXY71486.1 hypothetical protein AT272_13985 [Bacillus cereus]MCU5159642.1 hypothetical protein [Bacillus pacificus]MCU9945179.1 hypothetical protein [Bacillus pacificus]
MFLPITTFDRFSWLGNVAFSAEKINGNRALLRAEERDVNLYNKKCIDSVNNIHQELTIDSVKYNDNCISGRARPHSTIVITSGDMHVGSGRVNKYGEFKIYINNYREGDLVIEIQLIMGGFYQESITVKVEC